MNMRASKNFALVILFFILILFCVPISLNNHWGTWGWFTLSYVKSTEGIDFIRALSAVGEIGGSSGRFFPLQFIYYDTVDYLFNLGFNPDVLYFFNLLFIISIILVLFVVIYILSQSKDIIYYLFVPAILLNRNSALVLYMTDCHEPLLLVLLSLSLLFLLLYISNKSHSKFYLSMTLLFFILSLFQKETAFIFIFSMLISNIFILLLFKSKIDDALKSKIHKITLLAFGAVSFFLLVYFYSAKLSAFSGGSLAQSFSIFNIPEGIRYYTHNQAMLLIFIMLGFSFFLRMKSYHKTKRNISLDDYLLYTLSFSAALFITGLSLIERQSGRYMLPIYILLIPASCLSINIIKSCFIHYLQKIKIKRNFLKTLHIGCLFLILLIPLYLFTQGMIGGMIGYYNRAIQIKTIAELFTPFRNMCDAKIEDNSTLYLYNADRGDHNSYYYLTSYWIGTSQNKTIDIRSVNEVKNIAQFNLAASPKSTSYHKCLEDMRKFTAYTKFEPDDRYMNNSWILHVGGTNGFFPDVKELNIDHYENFKSIKEVVLVRATFISVASDILHKREIHLFTKKPLGYWAMKYTE